MSGPKHRVVVWEYEMRCIGSWIPYSPAVTQLLERAYCKNLTRVLLKDADPALAKYEVDLNKMQETSGNGARNVRAVRRCLYPSTSPAAQGIKWEWQPPPLINVWKRYPLDVQSLIEQAWQNNETMLDLERTPLQKPYLIDFVYMRHIARLQDTAYRIRRKKQAPYPMLKVLPPPCNAGPSSSGAFRKPRGFVPKGTVNRKPRAAICPPKPEEPYALPQPPSQGAAPPAPVNLPPPAQVPPPPPVPPQQQQQPPQTQGKFTQMLNTIFGSKPQHVPCVDYPVQAPIQHAAPLMVPHVPQMNPGPSTSGMMPSHLGPMSAPTMQQSVQGRYTFNAGCPPQPPPIVPELDGMRFLSLDHAVGPAPDQAQALQQQQQHQQHQQLQQQQPQFVGTGSDTASSHKGRRPSVDTVSTYLSHESQTSSRHHLDSSDVFDMLNCSIGSDEVFMPCAGVTETPRQPCPPARRTETATARQPAVPDTFVPFVVQKLSPPGTREIVGMTREWKSIAKFVRLAEPPCWPRALPCPMCMQELRSNMAEVNVSLSRCGHLMHLDCLNGLLVKQLQTAKPKHCYIECPTCTSVYGEKHGNQPEGSMYWELLSGALPGFPNTGIFEITYHISSGVQGLQHPNPGLAFFAVGFPRRCYLPNIPLGVKVLHYLRTAFYRGLLFKIGRSATTGVEDVVLWNSVEHKTQMSMYPDPQYLDRCLQQLIHLGVAD